MMPSALDVQVSKHLNRVSEILYSVTCSTEDDFPDVVFNKVGFLSKVEPAFNAFAGNEQQNAVNDAVWGASTHCSLNEFLKCLTP